MASIYPDAHEHGHDYPLCAHEEYPPEGPRDPLLIPKRSRDLSSLAGWPNAVTFEDCEAAFAAYGVPYVAPDPPPEPDPIVFVTLAGGTSLTIAAGTFGDAPIVSVSGESALTIAGGTFGVGLTIYMIPGEASTVTITGTGLDIDGSNQVTGTLSDSTPIDCTVTLDGSVLDSESSTAIVFVPDEA